MSNLLSSVREALDESLGTVDLLAKDAAAVRLAKHYADLLDAGADAVKMGPAYLACLESLGMTPRARAAIAGKGVTPSGSGDNPLDRLRARRSGQQGTASVDATSA